MKSRKQQHSQAESNYFHLDSDQRSQNNRRSRLSSLTQQPHETNTETLVDEAMEKATQHFGFQRGSVDNQKEHLVLLLTNYEARHQTNTPQPVARLHSKLFSNYRSWCAFLHIQPMGCVDQSLGLYMDLSLYLLIWGEAANVRHMPECVCFLYHQMMTKLNQQITTTTTTTQQQPEGLFLLHVIRPIWEECSGMKQKNALGRPLEHVKVRNYDDINEFFWQKKCLDIQYDQVGAHLAQQPETKTFHEHRSMTSFLLNYFRIFHFNFMFFTLLTVLSYMVSISPNGAKSWLAQFGAIGQFVPPFTQRDFDLSLVFIPLVHALATSLKCLLELGHGWHSLFLAHGADKSVTYTATLFGRLLWNGVFCFIFLVMVTKPETKVSDNLLMDLFWPCAVVYLIPGSTILFVQAFAPNLIRNTSLVKSIREGESCFIGRDLSPPFAIQMQYFFFWFVLLLMKAIVSYSVLISPLMLPSLGIYSMKLNYKSNVIDAHNLPVIIALWLPVVCVFMYDTQIYFTIFQAIVGAVKGILMKTGELHGVEKLSKAFRVAPQLFDQKLVTAQARANDAAGAGDNSPFQSQMMLRFVVVWNEIVNSFREGDLIDDKETAILQYDIQNTGEVFEPVFLSAGKLSDAMTVILKCHKTGRGDSELRISLVKENCSSAIRSFVTASFVVMETLFGEEDMEVIEGLRMMSDMIGSRGDFLNSFSIDHLLQLRTVIIEFLETVLDLPDPDSSCAQLEGVAVHSIGVVRNFVAKVDNLLNVLKMFCSANGKNQAQLVGCLSRCKFSSQGGNGYFYAQRGLVNLFHSDMAMRAATRAYLLLSLEPQDAMPRCSEAQRRLGFFMKSLVMDIPQLTCIKEMHSFSVVTPFYSETVMFSIEDLNNPLENHPIFQKVEEDGKNITILKYLTTCHPDEWENFLERIDAVNLEEALVMFPQEVRLWASYRGQTLARTVQGMMLYEDAIKILHWLEIGSSTDKSPEDKQMQLEDMVRLKFSYICGCQVYGKHRQENQQQAEDIDFLLVSYPNLRVAYVDQVVVESGAFEYDAVLIKSQDQDIVEVYRYQLPGDPILGEGKPENQNNALQFTRGEYLQTIDMNQEHYFEECLKMPQLLETADRHEKPVSIIGIREHIFTGNASSLAKFKTWQELVFVTLSQRVLANPLYTRMHYGHPDVFDKVLALSRGGVSKASKGINLSEDVFAGFNTTLRGGIVTHEEFIQCGKGRDVALSQISMFEAKLANGSGETSLSREAHRLGQFLDFFRLNSFFYSHTGFYYATWLTVITAFVYMYCKLYVTLAGVHEQIVYQMNSTVVIKSNWDKGFDKEVFRDLDAVSNTQYIIQAGLFLTLPLIAVYFAEMGICRGFFRFIEMVITMGPAFFVFQVGTTMHYFDNNLIHGGGKYQATGRGFKITRESFVLLYKAYASSHYRRGFELISLCLGYLVYGNFAICEKKTDLENGDAFARNFCETSQSFGAQTFAIWFIAVLWLISPFIFNTDGLDWEKTKADIVSWTNWMFMNESDKDEDKINVGGWISWYKSDMDQLKCTNNTARFTIFLRELRHFVVLWYVVTLKHDVQMVFFVLGAVVAALVLFGLFDIMGKCLMKTVLPLARAFVYLLVVIGAIVSFFLVTAYVFDWESQKSTAIFWGFTAALFAISEISRVCAWEVSGVNLSKVGIFQELTFFFDFMIGVLLLLPLFILSGIPFMNIIQTRMMYNEGFSQVMSASSQYAFSLAAFIGLLGGTCVGWLFQLLSNLDTNLDFRSFTKVYNLNVALDKAEASYFIYWSGAIGVILSGILAFVIGRRFTIMLGGLSVVSGMVLISFIKSSAGEGFLFPGLAILGGGMGVLLPTLPVYSYEISTKEMRGKAILLLGIGMLLGALLAAQLVADGVGWIWQVFWSTILIVVLTPMVNMFPESPVWVLQRHGKEAAETCLCILRRKQDVEEELKELLEQHLLLNARSLCGASLFLKMVVVLLFQFFYAISLATVNQFTQKLYLAVDTQSRMLPSALGVALAAAFISFFFIDKLDHRSILLITLLPISACTALLAVNEKYEIWTELVYSKVLSFLLYFFQGLGLSGIMWVSAVGLFPVRARDVFTYASFGLFFLTPALGVYYRVHFNSFFYILCGQSLCGVILTLLILIFMGKRKNGMLCTRGEMKQDKEKEKALLEARQRNMSARTPGSSRSRNINRSRSKSRSKSGSNYHLFESPHNNARQQP